MAKKFKVHKRIIFLGAIRHIQNALSISDVAILPTFYDPCSRYILEALAANKPVITTRFNGASEQFVNDRHGKVIDAPEDTAGLAKAISYFTDTDNIQKTSEAIIEDARVLIVLPPGVSESKVKTGEILWSNVQYEGDRLAVYWEKQNLLAGESFSVGVSYPKQEGWISFTQGSDGLGGFLRDFWPLLLFGVVGVVFVFF